MIIDILVPAYNEAASLPELIDRIIVSISLAQSDSGILDKSLDFDYKIYIGDNYSSDNTLEVVQMLQSKYPGKIYLVQNHRNYGYEHSAWNLFRLSRGNAAVHILSDLEDPPELVGELIVGWLLRDVSIDSIFASKLTNKTELYFYQFFRRLFYLLSRIFLRIKLPVGYHGVGIYSDFVIKDAVWLFSRSSLNIRSCLVSCSDSFASIHYKKMLRKHGKSSLNFRRNAAIAVESIFKQDRSYHTLIAIMCIFSFIFFLFCTIFALFNQILFKVYPSGTLTLSTIIGAFAITTSLSIYLLSSQISSIPKTRRTLKVRYTIK
ncbi:glycosyltransferase [Synechococcus sp. MVIR-18-1]|uniref:glycosyltransferase n=1 Tax=Synechococcus sp. MVIR-18-1 TaxID=1386941 RepID=UPI0016440420|nr:glycosyltransferase [Synechococcus sp. MVIR-18-1]